MTMRKQAGQTKKNTTTAAHKTTRRSAGTKTAAKSTPSKKASANTGLISDLDCYLFGAGTHYEIYKKLGAHPMTYKGKKGIYFGVWAPHAQAVHLVGDFNGWNPEANPMTKVGQSGIWEYFNAGMQVGELYKFAITTDTGKILYKADPFAFSAEYRPGTASVTADISGFSWNDSDWISKRSQADMTKQPISIYEVHLGSWKKKDREEKDGYYTYVEAAHELAAYVKEMGYTHVELLPIMEHPLDASWGYQVTGYYAPTSRYGTPDDFMYFMDYMHEQGIGVILDWVPAHFPRDAFGMACFDGTCVYEHADPRKGAHPHWGTLIYNYGRPGVSNFLIANALFWAEKYHADGIRMDAVASMLYLDYGKNDGEWVANIYGGNENLEAVEFLKHLNTVFKGRKNGAVLIAEESTAWPMITGDPKDGGLGFDYKWNMGWMNDFTNYMRCDPYFRKNNHNKMTFAMSYNESEKYILVLSHDEVVHLKCSMLNKMPGLEGDKFKNLMAGYAFMMGHCGKKLLFMGQEFAQKQEWSEERELDWYLLENPEHKKIQNWVKELLHLYRRNRCLYELDSSWEGFEWINANDADRSIFSFIRKSKDGKNNMLFVINFTPVERPDYRVGVPKHKTYQLVLDSEDPKFTGKTVQAPVKKAAKGRGKAAKQSYKKLDYKAVKSECDGRPFSFAYPLAPYGVAVFKY